VVYIKRSKNKLDCLRNKKNTFVSSNLLFSIEPSRPINNFFCFDWLNSALLFNIICTMIITIIIVISTTKQQQFTAISSLFLPLEVLVMTSQVWTPAKTLSLSNTHTHTHTQMHIQKYTHTYTHTHSHTLTHTHTHSHTLTHTNTHASIHTHTRTNANTVGAHKQIVCAALKGSTVTWLFF